MCLKLRRYGGAIVQCVSSFELSQDQSNQMSRELAKSDGEGQPGASMTGVADWPGLANTQLHVDLH